MTPTSRELLRQCLLKQLADAAPYAVPFATLKVYAVMFGFKEVTEQELAAELAYLADKSLIAADEKILSPENRRWKITADGRDFLATEGLG